MRDPGGFMASIYRRGKTWWISFCAGGKRRQQSLDTTNQRVAIDRQREIEALQELGQVAACSRIPLVPALEKFCQHMAARSPHRRLRLPIGIDELSIAPIQRAASWYS